MNAKLFRTIYIASLCGAIVAVGAVAVKSVPLAALVALIVAGSETVVYFVFIRPILMPERIIKIGEPAEAKILGLYDTGVTLNDNPQVRLVLEVHPKGGEPYKAQTKAVISRLEVQNYQPGMTVEVSIDPADRNTVALGVREGAGTDTPAPAASVTGPGAAPASEEEVRQTGEMIKNIDRANEALIASGSPAEALVLKAWELGTAVNGPDPAISFLLEVRPPDRPSFRAEATGLIARGSIPKFQEGNVIHVRYDPDDLTRVAVEHS